MVVLRRLAVENTLGVTFLYSSIVDCGKMLEALKGCVGSFDECVLPIIGPEEAKACQLRSDENAEYADWASTCGPRGDPLTIMVVAPSGMSLAMTVAFSVTFVIRTTKRIKARAAPRLKWNHLSDLHLKAILRFANQVDTGTKKELVDRVSHALGSANTALETRPEVHAANFDREHEDPRLLEDKSRLAIAHEELEKLKLQDTAFETLVFIPAIVLFAYKIQPMLMQKEGVGCGRSLV